MNGSIGVNQQPIQSLGQAEPESRKRVAWIVLGMYAFHPEGAIVLTKENPYLAYNPSAKGVLSVARDQREARGLVINPES